MRKVIATEHKGTGHQDYSTTDKRYESAKAFLL